MTEQQASWIKGLVGAVAGEAGLEGRPAPGLRSRRAVRRPTTRTTGRNCSARGVGTAGPNTRTGWAAQDTYGVLVVLQALDAGGKDSTIPARAERGEPAGGPGIQLQGAVPPRNSGTTTCGGRPGNYLHAVRSPSSTARTTKRCSSSASTGNCSTRRKLPPESPRRRRLETALPGDQRLGALPWPTRASAWSKCSSTCPGTSSGGVFPAPDRPPREELEVRRQRRGVNAGTGTTTRRAYSAMLSHTSTEWAPWYVPAPPTTSGSLACCAAAVIAQTLIDIDPHYPAPDPAARQGTGAGPPGNWRPRRPAE